VHLDLNMTPSTKLRVFLVVALAFAAGCGSSGVRPDASGVEDAGPTPDASPFGASCTTSSQCPDGGYCVEGYGGKVCTYACAGGCPDTWDCRVITVDGSLESVCVPPDFELCTPCASDSQCGGGVCVSLGGDAFCLPSCPFEGPCPTGYECGADPTGQHPGEFCVPRTRNCSCTTGADEGQVRSCKNTNSIGACPGLETCRPNEGGWIGCTAPPATPEMCDGSDNDCDQLIDDGLTNSACMITVAGIGSCPGVSLCTGASGTICQGPTPQLERCNFGDDDCDGMVDETFAGIGDVCGTGVGGCQRFGVMRCTSAGTATECSAIAGAPNAELCNVIDDDCDGNSDETFPTKGAACSAGIGVCARQGNQVCSANGTSTVCSVLPGTPAAGELCNALDDDCDGRTDEGFLDQGTNQYQQDTACGSCAVDCTVLFGLPNASGHCVVTGSPQCTMTCDPNAFDLDAAVTNGCELQLDGGAIYVSVNDPAAADDASCGLGPVGTGAGHHPCLTIAQGTTRAASLTRTRVLIANGIYTESVTLANGISLLGGYASDTWQRDVASTGTLILGVSSAGSHDRTVVATNITAPTVFEGFAVFGATNAKLGGNSYAIYVAGSNASLAIQNNVVFGGRGGPGSDGVIGGDGTSGANAQGRITNLAISDAAYDAHDATDFGACSATNNRQYANGGSNSCGGDDVSGGAGGGNQCPAAAGAGCTTFGCTFITATSTDGFSGQPGAGPGGGAAGTGAARGDDMIAAGPPTNYCYIPSGTTYGRDGVNGARGAHGAAAPGCTGTGGGVIGGHWVGGGASAGVSGGNGGGGGGGGAGGGAKCQNCQGNKDKLGGHGGGGGAGGCGGVAGGAASAGGGAFGIFIVGTTAPVVTGNSVFRGSGGPGGGGGAGGKGGTGGDGAIGGTTGNPVTFCTELGGRGANGGDGGHGSGGGGGCGGSSYGIYTSGLGAPNYCQAAAMNTISSGGGGSGGPGGYSIINPGGAGLVGALLDCSFN